MTPASSDSTSSPVLDQGVLDGLRELGGDDLLQELAVLFLEDAPPRIEGLRENLATNNAEELGKVAHSLKSSAANIGAMALSEICRRLEESGRQGDLGGAEELVDQACASWEAVRAELDRLRS